MDKSHTRLLLSVVVAGGLFGISGLLGAWQGQAQPLRFAKLKYGGGGDWYANKTALPNVIRFVNEQLGTRIDPVEEIVEPNSPQLFNYPFVYMTGHGHFSFSKAEALHLRRYLLGGGFLHIDDNYGLNPYVRIEMKKVFPELTFKEVPLSHPIYRAPFAFPDGLPKIHEHDGKSPQAFALFYQNRMLCFYSYESDLGNGWEDAAVYNNPPNVRLKALKMGANIITYALAGALVEERHK